MIVGIGLTEPHAGSDAGVPHLRAVRDGDVWVLNGVKSLSFARDAAAVVVFARTSKEEVRGKGISAFLVPLNLPGVTREAYCDMGSRAIGRGAANFTEVRIPANHLLGEEGSGFSQVMQGFDFSRALIGLQCIGVARVTLDETWAYVSQREAFDLPLSKYQGVSFPLAEAETLLSAARLLCYQTLWLGDQRLPHTAQAAMCKWWVPKTAFEIVHNCLLLHGQYGYCTDLPLEQRLRDVVGVQIADGTAQIMKLITRAASSDVLLLREQVSTNTTHQRCPADYADCSGMRYRWLSLRRARAVVNRSRESAVATASQLPDRNFAANGNQTSATGD